MTLTSGKTATKRHAWLVGATAAAMAVALIGVGPIAANAESDAGELGVTVTAQSDTTALTFTGSGTTFSATGGSTAATGFTAAVTTKTTVGSTTATKDVTPSFTLGAVSGNVTVTALASGDGTTVTPNGEYTLTLTPSSFSGQDVTGAVSQSFTVIDGAIYVGGSEVDAGTPVSVKAPIVKATFGTVTALTGGDASFFEDGTAVAGVTPASAVSIYVPAGALYRVTATGARPALAGASVPFVGTGVSQLTNISGSASLLVSAGQAAPVTFGNAVATAWKAPAVSPFNDVRTSTQFYNEMSWLSATGVSTGYADGGYHPAATIKRNAEAAFLYRLAGSPKVTAAQEATTYKAFSDVNSSTQFHDAIAWLYTSGITTGYSDNTFRPAAEVTRGAMAAFLYRFVHNNTGTFTDSTDTVVETVDAPKSNYANGTFSDVYGSVQFAGDIAWLANKGAEGPTDGTDQDSNPGRAITTGYADGSFKPGASIKRNAMAAFLYRLVDVPYVG